MNVYSIKLVSIIGVCLFHKATLSKKLCSPEKGCCVALKRAVEFSKSSLTVKT